MTRNEIIQRVQFYASKYGIDPAVGVEQIRTESGFNPAIRNSIGAMGLGQFLPGTWEQYGQRRNPFDVEANLDAWGRFMRDLLRRFNGDHAKALIGYHAGPDAVAGVLRNPAGNPKTTAYYTGILQRAGNVLVSASNAAALTTTPRPPSTPDKLMIFAALVLVALAVSR